MWKKFGSLAVALWLVLALSSVAMAENAITINLDGMSPEQIGKIKDIQGQVTQKVVEVATTAETVVTAKVAETTAKVAEHTENVIESVTGIGGKALQDWSMNMAEGISVFCSTLNIEVNDFVKTPVGLAISAFAAFKVAGDEISTFAIWIKDVSFSTFIYFFMICIIGWNYKRKRGFYKWTNKTTGEITITPKYTWPQSKVEGIMVETWSTVWHVAVFLGFTMWFISVVL